MRPFVIILRPLVVVVVVRWCVVPVARQQRPSGRVASNAVNSSTVAVNHLFVGRDMMNNSVAGSGRCAGWPRPLKSFSLGGSLVYWLGRWIPGRRDG